MSNSNLRSVRSSLVLSKDSLSGEGWRDFCDQLESNGWFINRTRQRSDGMFYIYIVQPGHRGF